MRQQLKRRLAIFLSVMMILPMVIAALPMTALKASAASSYVSLTWNLQGSYDKGIQVEKGAKFYIGDYVNVYVTDFSKGWTKTASMVNASYKSSKSSVASVSKKGYLTAKKTGTTTITVKYRGKSTTMKVKVVSAKSFKSSSAVSEVKKRAATLAKSVPSKITTKNGYKILKAVSAYREAVKSNSEKISEAGVLRGTITSSWGTYKGENGKLAVPQAGRYFTLKAMLDQFEQKNNPTSTYSAKVLNIKSVSATTDAVTVKLKKKVDASQILSAQISAQLGYSGVDQPLSSSTKAYIIVYLYDTQSGQSYRSIGELKKGSDILKITPQIWSDSKYVKTNLETGHTYQLGYYVKDWTKGKTVKVN